MKVEVVMMTRHGENQQYTNKEWEGLGIQPRRQVKVWKGGGSEEVQLSLTRFSFLLLPGSAKL